MKKRIEYIDVYRGIGIILMIMGHIYFGKLFDIFIHAFHIPMFFIISGYLFSTKNVDFKEFIMKKSKQLLVPYIVFGVFHLIIYILMNLNSIDNITSRTFALFFMPTNSMPISGALWFLLSLFFADIMYYFIIKINNKIVRTIISLVISSIGILISYFFRLPYGMDVAMVAVFLMNIGSYIKEYKDKIFNINIFIMILLGILDVVLIYTNGMVGFKSGIYSNVLLFFINAIVSSVIILYISNLICNIKLNKFKLYNYFKDLLIYIGSNSICYLIFNQLVIMVVLKVFEFLHIPTNYYVKVLIIPIVLFLLYIINKIFNTKRLKVLIGK